MAAINAATDKTAIRLTSDVYEAAARTIDENRRHYLGMSEIGDKCDRALWYSFRGFPQVPIDGRVIMLFRFGDHVETDLVHWLSAAGYAVTDRQLSFSDHAGLFCGHCDGIVHGVTDMPHIFEAKSCNKKAFEAFKQAGVKATQPKYYCQCQCYMGYAGLERALMAIQCKDDSAVYFERIYFNRTDFQSLKARARLIITANQAPEKCSDQDSITCQWCRHRSFCWYPEETIVTARVCGTCQNLKFQDLTRMCTHHGFQILQWGIGCPQWMEMQIG
jgi:hypothetical protein